MILNNRTVWAALAILFLAILTAGCGDTFRPTVNFVPTPGADQTTSGQAVVVSTNPSGNGSDTHINVSGDTNVGIVTVGPNPLFLGKASGRAVVINSDMTLTLYAGQVPLGSTITTVTLPGTTSGPIAAAASSNANLYIANRGSNDVSVIAIGGTIVNQVVPVGAEPVAVAANSTGNKAYVVNHSDNTVTVIGTADNAVLKTIPVGAQPIWAVMSDDGVDVFVVNQGDGTLSVIDTTLDIVFTTINLNGTGPSAALGSNFAFYDNVRKRVYVTNPGDNSVTVIKADSINLGVTPQILPIFLNKVHLSGSPLQVAAIADGTRAYAVLAGCPAGTNQINLLANLASCNGNQVSVIDVIGFHESKVITLNPPAFPPSETGIISGTVAITSSTDGAKVYVVHANDTVTIMDNVNSSPKPSQKRAVPSISIIRTATDSEVTDLSGQPVRIKPPQQNPSCIVGIDPTFNNKVPIPCDLQTPFAVVTFP